MPKIPVLLLVVGLTACAQATDSVNKGVTPAKLQADTASYFRTSPANVKISNMNQNVLGTSYRAHVKGHLYLCKTFKAAISCERAHY